MDHNTLPTISFLDLQKQRARIQPELEKAIRRVLNNGQFIMGPEVTALETALQTYTKAKHVITCASGTDALTLLLLSQHVGPGDAIFVPAFSFIATCEVIALLGAIPIFIDVDPIYAHIDIESLQKGIEQARKQNYRPRGIIAVDLFGIPAHYPALFDVAETEQLWVISDAAQSFGASVEDTKVGNLTSMTATSFFPSKPLGCYGDGGAIFVQEDTLAEKLRSLRAHGQSNQKYHHHAIGLNSRLDTLQAAILLEKFKILDDEQLRRAQIAQYYQTTCAHKMAISVQFPTHAQAISPSWAVYTLQCQGQTERDTLQRHLKDKGIPTVIYYPKALHEQEAYLHFPRATQTLPTSERLASCVLSIPMHAYLTDSQVEHIAHSLLSAPI